MPQVAKDAHHFLAIKVRTCEESVGWTNLGVADYNAKVDNNKKLRKKELVSRQRWKLGKQRCGKTTAYKALLKPELE